MKQAAWAVRSWLTEIADAWNRFWFAPMAVETLAAIRVLGGAMLFYTHLIWSRDLLGFLGKDGWLSRDAVTAIAPSPYAWSYLWYLESPTALWTAHVLALVVFLLLTIGLGTRVMSVLACVITLAYCHRLQGALYGLDQVNAMVALYLTIGPAGRAFSVDAWLARRRAARAVPSGQTSRTGQTGQAGQAMATVSRVAAAPSVAANVAIRLMQIHMCIVYLFGGISKLKGAMWWDGSAVWFAVANYEYQSVDMTWLGAHAWLISLLTHVTVFWETFYPVLIWPRLTRPVMLGLAVCVHGGIALFLGMPTFGLAMIIGNLAFVPPEVFRAVWDRPKNNLDN